MRKKIIAGNWKMNKNNEDALKLTSEIVHIFKDEIKTKPADLEIILIPPFVHVGSVALLTKNSGISVGAQDCSSNAKGAFTGEVSAEMIKSVGANYVLVGHSERRQFHAENNELLKTKMVQAFQSGLIPIYCVGETLEEREANKHFTTVENQITDALFLFSEAEMKNIIVAYEPVWAIGTGKTASNEQAQEMHLFIRKTIADKFGNAIANNISILYGGSMKPENSKELLAQPDIDGGLIGGAALLSRDFINIIKSAI